MDKQEGRDIVWTPNDAVASALDVIRQRMKTIGLGVRLGIADVDDYLLPARPGELITVLGRTSNYKTGFMQYWARSAANQIVEEKVLGQCVVYVTWEQAVEEMVAFDLAYTARISATDLYQSRINDKEMERIRKIIAPQRAMLPVYLIGHSAQEGRRRPRLTLSAVAVGLKIIREEFELKPRVIVLDYLQQSETERGEDRRMQMYEVVYRCKDMALAFGCPVVMGCQVRREEYKSKWGVPSITAGAETSNVEHTSDKILGLWYPIRQYVPGLSLEAPDKSTIEVTENTLILRVLKQRMGPAGRWFVLYVDAARNELASMVRAKLLVSLPTS